MKIVEIHKITLEFNREEIEALKFILKSYTKSDYQDFSIELNDLLHEG